MHLKVNVRYLCKLPREEKCYTARQHFNCSRRRAAPHCRDVASSDTLRHLALRRQNGEVSRLIFSKSERQIANVIDAAEPLVHCGTKHWRGIATSCRALKITITSRRFTPLTSSSAPLHLFRLLLLATTPASSLSTGLHRGSSLSMISPRCSHCALEPMRH